MRITSALSILLSLAPACGPDPASTDTDTDADADTDDGETSQSTTAVTTGEPDACPEQPDPATVVEFRVTLDAWPDVDYEQEMNRVCTIDAITVEAAQETAHITCDVDGTPRQATLEVAAAPEGPIDWQAGQSIALQHRAFGDGFSLDWRLHVTLADDPAALLIDGRNWWEEYNTDDTVQIGPIRRELLSSCSPGEGDRNTLRYSLDTGPRLDLRSGERGTLAIDTGHIYAVDLQLSGIDLYHDSERSLIRRVRSE